MASPETLDLELLLRPISEDRPEGVELRDDPSGQALFFQTKEAREAARSVERRLLQSRVLQDEAAGPADRPNWQLVRDLATQILAEHSKDLWVCAWLIEAQARLAGFAGLRDGFRLVRGIAEQFWDGIHPAPDEDGFATTVAQLTGLNGEDAEGALVAPIDQISIVPATSLPPLTSAQYLDATELAKAEPNQRERRLAQGACSLEMFDKAVREAPADFFRNLHEDVSAALDEFEQMGRVLEEKCGRDEHGYSLAPPSSNIREAISAVRARIEALARHLFARDEAVVAAPVGAGGDNSPIAGPGSAAAIPSREEAFRALLKVADYFHRTEPHSPVSYALKQAARWGSMSLPELMKDLIRDDAARGDMFRRLGIQDDRDSEN
jgi:type VI secretion system protein ImpA